MSSQRRKNAPSASSATPAATASITTSHALPSPSNPHSATPPNQSSFLARSQELQQSLTCTVCTSIFSDPVTLSCGHSFCMNCLRRSGKPPAPFACYVCKQFTAPATYSVSFCLRDAANSFAECGECTAPKDSASRKRDGSQPKTVTFSTPPAASSVSRSFGLLRLGWIANADIATVCNLVGLLICILLSFHLLRDFVFASSSSSSSSSGSDALRFANNDAYALYDKQRSLVFEAMKAGESARGSSGSSGDGQDGDSESSFIEDACSVIWSILCLAGNIIVLIIRSGP